MPKGAEFIIRSLENAGFEAYIVGGCVRDGILGRDPEDWDITTIAKPDEIKRIFSHTVDTGIEHGTVTVLVPPEEVERGIRSFEVTTYRIDGEYTDHRHPNAVSFTGSLEEDLARRDFTINSLAYSKKTGIVGLYGGKQDIRRKVIRFVGKPKLRIEEDALRILRAFRFVSKLGFSLDKQTAEAIYKKRKFLLKISGERVFDELSKILMGNFVKKAFIEMKKLKVLEMLIPEFRYAYNFDQNNPNNPDDLFHHIIKVIHLCDYDLVTRFAALFHDLGKINVKLLMQREFSTFMGMKRKAH